MAKSKSKSKNRRRKKRQRREENKLKREESKRDWKKISEITSFVLGQVIMWFGAITIIGGLTWIAVKIWTSIIHMIF